MGVGCSSTANRDLTSTTVNPSSKADATALIKLLGDTIRTSSGDVPTGEALAGKTVGLYFSAHWCPPCRSFTPFLAKAYKQTFKAKDFEIVFISSDRDEAAFNGYFNEMPWLALPFAKRELKTSLGSRYRVNGIPTLVLLGADGKLITTEGRAKITQDPSGKSWLPAAPAAAAGTPAVAPSPTPPSAGGLSAALGSGPFLASDGRTKLALADIAQGAPLVALYFSAHWCGPCRGFTPKLVTFVEMLEEEGRKLPVIFGSSDRDAAAFDEYFASMPWFAFPHGDARIEALKAKFEVSGIPWLVVLDAQTGALVMNEADNDVPAGPHAAYDKWLKLAKAQKPEAAPAA